MNVKREPPEYAFPDVTDLQTWTEVSYNEPITIRNGDDEKDEQKSRLYQNAVRTAIRRSMESKQQSLDRRQKNALRAAERRSMETPEKRALRLEKDRVRFVAVLSNFYSKPNFVLY